MPSPQLVSSPFKHQQTTAIRFLKSLKSSLFNGNSQLQKTLNGGNESAIGLGAAGPFVLLIQQALIQLG